MADHTADTDWIDCHGLRGDEEAGGNRERGPGAGVAGGSGYDRLLRLIEPDGSSQDIAIPMRAGFGLSRFERVDEAEKAAADARAAEEKARAEAEETARREAEAKAKKEADEQDRKEAEEKARLEAEAKAKREAEARKAAEEKARKEAEAKAKREAEEQARKAAEAKAKKEAEEKARREAEAKKAAEEQARKAAEAKAKKEAEEKARKAAEAKAKKEAEEKARKAAEAKAKKEAEARKAAEEKARKEAEARAKREAEEKARKAAEARAKREAEEKARKAAEAKAKQEAEEKARKEAEARAKREAEEKARKAAEAKAKKEAEAKAKAEAEAKAREEAEALERARSRDLGKTFRRLISETGPISLAHFMAESNAHYYTTRDPLGEEADFITAPEVSQMFGELIGLWLTDLWVRMGARKKIHYVELGPGRGTLARDALRTAARYDLDPQIHFVETSPTLRKLQSEAFPNAVHHDDVSTLPEDAPLLLVANEFFDALPIHQLVRSAQGWHERMVGLEDGEFAYVAGDKPMDSIVPASWRSASQGTMIETSPAAAAVMGEIARRMATQGGAGLIIDYGAMELRAGSTLQAIRAHEKVDPLSAPGEADLTAHVDFELLRNVAKREGAAVMGVQMQGEWLRQMGIETRLEALERKNPAEKAKLRRQYERLTDDGQMGLLFKVLGIGGPRWPEGVGFD
ncbi:class I SAM-dependent methyltransferase [Qipengyuania nanhaisediminis]|uniref:class I SAM-dependent methyltransferase n=1 Tax=Qipengyuania nanhaisediminis TaxID=604088 RepID=UPI0038B37D17